MISRISQVVLLSGCLAVAGGASAFEREDLIVPVMAGVAVGVLLGSAGHDDHRHHQRNYRQPQVVYYQPRPARVYRYAPVRYVAVPIRDRRHRGHDGYWERRDYRDHRRY